MKRGGKLVVFLAVCASIGFLGIYHAVGAGKTARVSRVFDGDTLLLNDDTRVRLIGVDAPRWTRPIPSGSPMAPKARPFSHRW
jgi:endonuclease YncB( thermonuclease family)